MNCIDLRNFKMPKYISPCMLNDDYKNFLIALEQKQFDSFVLKYNDKYINEGFTVGNVYSLALYNALMDGNRDTVNKILQSANDSKIFNQVSNIQTCIIYLLSSYRIHFENGIIKVVSNFLEQNKDNITKVNLEGDEFKNIYRTLSQEIYGYETEYYNFDLFKKEFLQYLYTEDSLQILFDSIDLPREERLTNWKENEESSSNYSTQHKRKFEEGSFSTSDHLNKRTNSGPAIY